MTREDAAGDGETRRGFLAKPRSGDAPRARAPRLGGLAGGTPVAAAQSIRPG